MSGETSAFPQEGNPTAWHIVRLLQLLWYSKLKRYDTRAVVLYCAEWVKSGVDCHEEPNTWESEMSDEGRL